MIFEIEEIKNLKLTKKLNVKEIFDIYKSIGYYMPYERVKGHVHYAVYKEAVTMMVVTWFNRFDYPS